MKIKQLRIENIRGIKTFALSPEGDNVVVFGPNGTGKSAIVDAVDFLLTGEISRLTGEGTKNLSLKEHGSHIDSRNELKKSVVNAVIEVDGKEITLERSISKPSAIKVAPKGDEAFIEAHLEIAQLGQHILSRREILKYITAESSERAKEIQSLLNLARIENIRATFVTIKNEAEAGLKNAESNFNIAQRDIANLLSLPQFSEDLTLNKVNELRVVLKGSGVSKEEMAAGSFKKDIVPHLIGIKEEALKKQQVTKEQIENTIQEIQNLIKEKDALGKKESALRDILNNVQKDAQFKQHTMYIKLLDAGLSLAGDTSICPLCDREWTAGDFKAYLHDKKKHTEVAKEKQKEIDENAGQIKKKIDLLVNDVGILINAHNQFELKIVTADALAEFLSALKQWSAIMTEPLSSLEDNKYPPTALSEAIKNSFLEEKLIVPLQEALKKSGEQFSKQQTAWDSLTKMEDKWKRYKDTSQEREDSDLFKRRAETVLDVFEKSRDSVLNGVYDAIKDKFETYYRTIHSDDEENFSSKISPAGAGLNFEVDFYGRGHFPPHALHSEGHQDSMGLCLFFALNEYLTKSTIKIIVLDDTMMSIDRNHRRAICSLLKKYFPDRQLIITTHDTTWARQLRTEGVVKRKNMVHFQNWNIETGPIYELEKDLWDKIQEDLKKNDVPSAAHKLRRNAEWFFEDACDLLGSQISYRGDQRWELSEFANAAVSSYREYLRKAKANFQKMKQQDKFKEMEELEKKASEIITRSLIEQWIVNDNVHYNRWDESSKNDFEPVVAAFRELFSLFICQKCQASISKSEETGEHPKTIISCNCGQVFWNVG
jgi:DNA repair exonuclease SbcCD ATPase subunit